MKLTLWAVSVKCKAVEFVRWVRRRTLSLGFILANSIECLNCGRAAEVRTLYRALSDEETAWRQIN